MKQFLLLTLLLLSGFPLQAKPASTAPGNDADPFLARLAASLGSVTTVCSEFEQERRMAFLADPLISKGMIVFRKPDTVRWETTQPYRSILIANGKDVAQFEWVNGAWNKLRIGYAAAIAKIMESLTLTWSGRLAEQRKDYEITVSKGSNVVLTMVPRDSGVRDFISAIELHFAKDLSTAQQIVLREPSGDMTIIRFVNQHLNANMPADCFDVDHPVALEQVRQVIRDAK